MQKVLASTLLLSILLCVLSHSSAQVVVDANDGTIDTTITTNHSPVKATLYSTFLPGLGQAYNKKWWKVPLVYAGIGIPLYYAIQEHNDFRDLRSEYRSRTSGDSVIVNDFPELTEDNLLDFIDIKRRNRDFLIIVSSLVYVLNIVDASVDAHFFDYNVSDDLSLRVEPQFRPMAYQGRKDPYYAGIRLCLTFN